jgi:hypothetical protein
MRVLTIAFIGFIFLIVVFIIFSRYLKTTLTDTKGQCTLYLYDTVQLLKIPYWQVTKIILFFRKVMVSERHFFFIKVNIVSKFRVSAANNLLYLL